MTPSINRLANAAADLGAHVMELEWDLIVREFAEANLDTLAEFKEWVQNYMYYNALICACSGNIDQINRQLEDDWEELVVSVGS